MKSNSRLNMSPLRGCQTTRNPILQQDVQLSSPRPSKARPQHIPDSRLAGEKPRGLAKGQFSDLLQGSFFVGKDPTLPYKPWRKQVITLKPRDDTPPVAVRTSHLTPPRRNPILQDSTEFETPPRPISPHWTPSHQMETENNKRHLLPADLGRRTPTSMNRTQSHVFAVSEDSDKRPISPAGRKSVPVRQSPTAALLSYRFALPYRETSLSPKPSEVPFKQLESGK